MYCMIIKLSYYAFFSTQKKDYWFFKGFQNIRDQRQIMGEYSDPELGDILILLIIGV